jgi:hypothetical protein
VKCTALFQFSKCSSFVFVAGKSLIKWVLLQVEEFLYQENLTVEWACAPNHSNNSGGGGAVFEVKSAVGFHRLWSALSFLFCIVDGAGETAVGADGGEVPATATLISNEAEFGHGFTIAGCALLHLLGQRGVFEVLDFSGYVLQMDAHEARLKAGLPAEAVGVKVDQSLVQETNCFVTAARTQQLLQKQLFTLFEARHKTRESYTKLSSYNVTLHPPQES